MPLAFAVADTLWLHFTPQRGLGPSTAGIGFTGAVCALFFVLSRAATAAHVDLYSDRVEETALRRPTRVVTNSDIRSFKEVRQGRGYAYELAGSVATVRFSDSIGDRKELIQALYDRAKSSPKLVTIEDANGCTAFNG